MEIENIQPTSSKVSDPIPIPNINEISNSNSNSNSPKSISKHQYSASPFDVRSILHSLSNWLRGIQEKEFDVEEYKEREIDLWRDWEWILSTTEEFLLKQNQSETQKVLGELDNLKRTASNLKIKPIFINRASEIIKTLTEADLETLKQPLDSNKRLGVINTVINEMESQWLNYIQEKFFNNEINSTHNINTSSPLLTPSQTQQQQQNNTENTVENKESNYSTKNISNQIESLSIEEGWGEDSLKSPLFKSSKSSTLVLGSVLFSKEEVTLQQHENKENIDYKQNPLILNDSTGSIAADMVVLNKNINKITWDQFLENFRGQKYSKGVNTRMKDISWQASHGIDGSLNARVAGDIAWSIWNTLNTAIKQIREVTHEESIELTEKVNNLQPLLIQIWINTKRNSAIGSRNEGLVVEKWKEEELKKKKKIQELKKSGKLDKYSPEKIKILDHEKKEISSIRSTLENKLKLKTR